MAQLGYVVDPNLKEQSFEPIPAGEYPAIITESDLKPTKDGTGTILALKYEIVDGEYKGRGIYENLNIKNKNPQAQQIAVNALNEIGKVLGMKDIKDSVLLHGRPLVIKLRVKDDPTYGAKNEVKAHLPYEGKKGVSNVPSSTPSAQPSEAAPSSGEKKFQWEIK